MRDLASSCDGCSLLFAVDNIPGCALSCSVRATMTGRVEANERVALVVLVRQGAPTMQWRPSLEEPDSIDSEAVWLPCHFQIEGEEHGGGS